MANLVELFDNIVQMQNLNGVPLAAGKLYVYALGRTRLMDSWSDVDGESLNPNPIILDDAGQAHVYVSDDFDYTLVVCDQYNNEIFSLDKYLYSKGSHSHADVAVAPSESIAVSSYHVGECTVYVPYLTGQLGKVYEGIDPIVVNNQVDKISANHVPLGVQDPLYFVQDDEEACIIGFSGEALPEGTMNESAFGYEDGQITSYNGSAFSAGNSYEAGSYVDIDGNTINVTGLQPAGNYQSAGDYVSASELENLQPKGDYYSASNPSGFITGVDLTDYAKTEDLTAYQPVGDYYSASNPSGFINSDAISAMATTGFVADVSGDITALIPTDLFTKESADTLYQPIGDYQTTLTFNYTNDNEISGINGSAIAGQSVTGDFELSAGSGISIVDYPLEQKTVISVTAQGGNPEVEQAVIDNSATWNTVSDKLDTTAFSDVSGTFLTAHQDLSDYQTIAGMTAYQPAGDYLTTSDSANFATTGDIEDLVSAISETYQPITAMTAYQAAGNYLSANALDELSGNWETVTAKQNALTFGYNDTAISAIDNSGLYDYSAHARINTLAGRISDLSSNKLDTTAFSDVSGTFLTAVPDTYLQNTDLTITDGKVTEISGVPLSAGDELPSGVMNTSALEYNAVNEISAYNGSAIAQYGAEKQFLVHDDTLVSISNSAQYALGVNLSAVAKLLGVDETVLWSGNVWDKNIEMVLSDSLKNYDSYKVYGYNTENKYGIVNEYTYNSAGPNWFSLTDTRIQNNAYLTIYGSFVSANPDWDKLTITYMSNKYCISGGLAHSTTFGVGITKIVGIGRKA